MKQKWVMALMLTRGCSVNSSAGAVTGESDAFPGFRQAEGGVSAPYPGAIVPVDLAECGGRITCQKDAFLCAAQSWILLLASVLVPVSVRVLF